MRQALIQIDLTALRHNLQRVRELAPRARVMCMVKADAYGIGLEAALQAFTDADGLGVACLQEAQAVRALGCRLPITLVEGIFARDELTHAVELGCECVVHQPQQVDWLVDHAKAYQAAGLKVWVKLNSGMNRLGFLPAACIDVIQRLQATGFECVLMMHFANADQPGHPLNEQQIRQLAEVRQACGPVKVSCCNSAALINWPDLHFDYVRPGIMLYGASPFADRSAASLGLRAVHHLLAAVIALHALQPGQRVGYGSHYEVQQPMQLAVVSIGYGDGFPRTSLQPNYVIVHQQLCPVVGRVSMDMLTVDVTHLTDVDVGTVVELWGQQRAIDDVAAAYGTIGYELLCRMTQRPVRHIMQQVNPLV